MTQSQLIDTTYDEVMDTFDSFLSFSKSEVEAYIEVEWGKVGKSEPIPFTVKVDGMEGHGSFYMDDITTPVSAVCNTCFYPPVSLSEKS